jgi:2-hydroxychromene-2-carboxylate isomerase
MKQVDFYFDLSSPYSYLAATQLEGVATRAGASVRWRPFVLAAVFKATTNEMPARVPAKARYMLKDLERWAKHYNVPFQFTTRFPVNAMTAMRCIVAPEAHGKAGALALEFFRAVWERDEDVTDPSVLRKIIEVVGLDSGAILTAATTDDGKKQLRQNGEDALEAGAFGAPTMVVGEELFWGNDRLAFVEEALKAHPLSS